MKKPKIIDFDDLPQQANTELRDLILEWAKSIQFDGEPCEKETCPACAFIALDAKMRMGEEPPTGWTWFRGVHDV